MSKLFEKIYASAPIFIQNLAVSYQGRIYNKKRYGGKYSNYLDQIMRSQRLDGVSLKVLQNNSLIGIVKEAIQKTAYYKEAFESIGDITNISLETLCKLPLLEKSLLRTETEKFINKSRLQYGYDEGHTSGTSGIPLIFPYDLDSLKRNLVFRERQYRWAGLTGKEKSARFSGRLLLGKHSGPPYWRFNKPENQWLFSSYHINEKTWKLYYETFRELEIAFLDGYPSSIFNLAKFIDIAGLNGKWRPWAIFLTGEAVMDYQREVIEKAFGCRVFNFYSSSEGAPYITECEYANMHVNPESGIVEFLREDGSYAELGEESEMVVTSFFQRTLPLIRYRIGDVGALSENQDCPCGRKFPVVKSIGGREDDVLYTTQRGKIGSAGLSTALYKIPRRLTQSQIEQTGEDEFIFRYIPQGEELSDDEKNTLLGQLFDRLGDKVRIDICKVEDIPIGARGKTQLVIGLKKNK